MVATKSVCRCTKCGYEEVVYSNENYTPVCENNECSNYGQPIYNRASTITHYETPNEDYFEGINDYLDGSMAV